VEEDKVANKLTKPQRRLMVRAMRAGKPVVVEGAERCVAGRLSALGYGTVGQMLFCADRAGLEALLYDRKLEDWRTGSMASMADVREVETALGLVPA
jgi:hypothetical protein